MNVRVSGPGRHHRVACFQGTFGSTDPCDQAQITKKGDAVFSQSNLPAFQAMSVVDGAAAGDRRETPRRILDERWSLDKRVQPDPGHRGRGMGLLVLVVAERSGS